VNAATGARGLDRDGADWRFGLACHPLSVLRAFVAGLRPSALGGGRAFDMKQKTTTFKEE
jgi:hypothetical protein